MPEKISILKIHNLLFDLSNMFQINHELPSKSVL